MRALPLPAPPILERFLPSIQKKRMQGAVIGHGFLRLGGSISASEPPRHCVVLDPYLALMLPVLLAADIRRTVSFSWDDLVPTIAQTESGNKTKAALPSLDISSIRRLP